MSGYDEKGSAMASRKAYDEPTTVSALQGEVVLDGPDGVGLSMTPEAAEETGKRLREAARVARGQLGRRRPPEGATN